PSTVALGMFFFQAEAEARAAARAVVARELEAHSLCLLGWREVPVDPEALGERAREAMPAIDQALIAPTNGLGELAFERTLFIARKAMEQDFAREGLAAYVPSLSCRTVVYKGLLLGTTLKQFYPDLTDPIVKTALAVYHQRYSTNTFPTWERAQPFRMLSHNGEINTVQGNANWMHARQAVLHLPADFLEVAVDGPSALNPVLDDTGSDSGMLDNTLELLVLAGRDVRHALAMLVPEAWEKIPDMSPALRAFYQYHACLVEPWDGPAALTFSDGRIVGTSLDRNGLRPARYIITDDGLVISGSEVGAVAIDEARIVHKGKLGPGQMVAVDTATGRFFTDEEVKEYLAQQQPYEAWVGQHLRRMAQVAEEVRNAGGDTPALPYPSAATL
ncbi:MAG: glutamate synthase subunit alpha, partial [Chloroflexia bacterium]|nr:glutamate synthase subunit alpha [Chloroflexia bacterium]